MRVNNLAKIVIEVLTERHDAAYVEEKLEEFGRLSEFETLTWLKNLDGENLGAVAVKLGVTANDLRIAIAIARKIE